MLHKELILELFSKSFVEYHNDIVETDLEVISKSESEVLNYRPQDEAILFIEYHGTSHIYLIVTAAESVFEKLYDIGESEKKSMGVSGTRDYYILPIKEVMNTVSGQLLESLQIGGHVLTTRPPKAVIGTIYLPSLTASVSTCETNYGEISFAVCVDLMQNKLQRRLDQAEAVAEAKSQFLANITHELRTPLNSIMGFVQLLQRRRGAQTDERFTKYIEAIEKNSANLLELVNATLDMTTIDVGSLTLFRQTVNVSSVIKFVIEANMKKAEEKGLFLSAFDIDETLEIQADVDRLTQMLKILISNAIKCTKSGSVMVTMKVYERATLFVKHNIPALAIIVEDTGMGIKREDVPKLFQRLTQLDESSTREIQGAGMGLSIAMALANLHGGNIEVESAVDEGSTFTLLLPTGVSPILG